MQIVKDKEIVNDTWRYIADEEEPVTGDISVSLARWKKDRQELLNRNGKLGIRISPDDSVTELSGDLAHIQLVELDFPEFADGRLFSQAWLLRRRYTFQGEIRATGYFMPDQIFSLSRVGVNAFAPAKAERVFDLITYLNDFTVTYQESVN